MYPRPIPEDAPVRRFAYAAMVALVLILWLVPLAAVMATSLRSFEEVMAGNYWGWPKSFNFVENYTAVFTQTAMAQYFLNSLIVTLPSVLGVLVLSTLTGFVLSRYRFRGANLLFALFVGGNFLPAQIMMIPVRDLMVSVGLYDTYYALMVFHIAFQTGFATLFMRNFIAALPDELFQAARAEGASPWQTLWHVVVPLIRPALAALAILTFTYWWNDLLMPLVMIRDTELQTLPVGLVLLAGRFSTGSLGTIAAGITLAVIPVLIVFIVAQRWIVQSIASSGLKL